MKSPMSCWRPHRYPQLLSNFILSWAFKLVSQEEQNSASKYFCTIQLARITFQNHFIWHLYPIHRLHIHMYRFHNFLVFHNIQLAVEIRPCNCLDDCRIRSVEARFFNFSSNEPPVLWKHHACFHSWERSSKRITQTIDSLGNLCHNFFHSTRTSLLETRHQTSPGLITTFTSSSPVWQSPLDSGH